MGPLFGVLGGHHQYFNTIIDSLLQGPRGQSSEILKSIPSLFNIHFLKITPSVVSVLSILLSTLRMYTGNVAPVKQERAGSTKNNILLTVDLLLNFSLRSCI